MNSNKVLLLTHRSTFLFVHSASTTLLKKYSLQLPRSRARRYAILRFLFVKLKILALFLLMANSAMGDEYIKCDDVEPVKTVAPKYPQKESPWPHSGYVLVAFKISDRGSVYEPVVLESKAEPNEGWTQLFEEQALKSIKQWRYRYREKACVAEQKFTFEVAE